jgi:hypothetical protein
MDISVSLLLILQCLCIFSTSLAASDLSEKSSSPLSSPKEGRSAPKSLKLLKPKLTSNSRENSRRHSRNPQQILLILDQNFAKGTQLLLKQQDGKIVRQELLDILKESKVKLFFITDVDQLNELGDSFGDACKNKNMDIAIELYYPPTLETTAQLMEKYAKSKIAICTGNDSSQIFEDLAYYLIPIFLPQLIDRGASELIGDKRYTYEQLLFDSPEKLPELPFYYVLKYLFDNLLNIKFDYTSKLFSFTREEKNRITEYCIEYFYQVRKTPKLHGFRKSKKEIDSSASEAELNSARSRSRHSLISSADSDSASAPSTPWPAPRSGRHSLTSSADSTSSANSPKEQKWLYILGADKIPIRVYTVNSRKIFFTGLENKLKQYNVNVLIILQKEGRDLPFEKLNEQIKLEVKTNPTRDEFSNAVIENQNSIVAILVQGGDAELLGILIRYSFPLAMKHAQERNEIISTGAKEYKWKELLQSPNAPKNCLHLLSNPILDGLESRFLDREVPCFDDERLKLQVSALSDLLYLKDPKSASKTSS